MPEATETSLFFLGSLLILILLAALAATDLKKGLLPDRLTASLALCGLGLLALSGELDETLSLHFMAAGAAGGLLLILRHISFYLCKEESLGLGDVKLAAAGGLLLGMPHIMTALFIGALIGILHGLVIWRRSPESVTLAKINIPAGLGLCLGIAIVWLMQYGFAKP